MNDKERGEFEACFKEDCPEIALFLSEQTASTNDDAKHYARESSENAVFIAEHQTSGRGRLGRSFDSDVGGLYFSYLFHPRLPARNALMMTVYAAVSLCRTLEELIPGIRPEIKWVNDVRLGGKKLAGILTEGAIGADGGLEYAVIGIGVNVRHRAYPAELETIATDVESECGVKLSIARLASRLTHHLLGFDTAHPSEYLDEYRRRSCVIGKRVTVLGGKEPYEALAIAITDEGELRVRLDNGTEKNLFTGEVSIKI